MRLVYRGGDATEPVGTGTLLLLHVANNRGGWGKGFTHALSKRWPRAEADYRAWYRRQAVDVPLESRLGTIINSHVEASDLRHTFVISMIAQDGYSTPDHPALRYDALYKCLTKIRELIASRIFPLDPVSLHMPRIGTGLAGGRWTHVERLLHHAFAERSIVGTVYDLVPYEDDDDTEVPAVCEIIKPGSSSRSPKSV